MVKGWVDCFRAHRRTLEADVVHGRRADGRDVDWILHADATLPPPGMPVAFNPLDRPVTRRLRVNLH